MLRNIVSLLVLCSLLPSLVIAATPSPTLGDWQLVRRVTSDHLGWHPADDNLAGTAVYGTYSHDGNETGNSTFGIDFESAVPGWDQILLMTGDRVHWMILDRRQLSIMGRNVLMTILASSISSTPYRVTFFNRGSINPEDPWLSLRDHWYVGRDVTENDEVHSMLYGEASYDGWNFWRQNHQGANVFIRNSTGDVPEAVSYSQLSSTPDINGNGTAELAALYRRGGRAAKVIVRDSKTKQRLNTLTFNRANAHPLGIAAVNDLTGEGAAEIAVLFRESNGQGVVQIRDALSGNWIGQLPFVGYGWDVKALTSLDLNNDGVTEIAVLAVTDDGRAVGVQIRDAITKVQRRWVGFPAVTGAQYLDLSSLPDINGNGTPELALLRQRPNGRVEVLIKDSASKATIRTVTFNSQDLTPLGIAPLNDINGNASPEVALLLRKANGQGIARIRDALTGQWIHQIPFVGKAWDVLALTSQDSDRDGVSELSVLAVKDDASAAGVQIRDAATREPVNWVPFPTE